MLASRGSSLTNDVLVGSPVAFTLGYRDGSYVKLRGVTLGYNLPTAWLSKVAISSARVYVQGKNLVTLSEIDNYDPERGGAITTPIPRVVSAGINLGF
ncbi:hypothetical protein [uncultured Hymenobacter sp.]|uniref:hypothetical protein n=1 Tax=uncultured Hymenobacter sp. TaxID=170016 RepID=UPI0035C9D9B1